MLHTALSPTPVKEGQPFLHLNFFPKENWDVIVDCAAAQLDLGSLILFSKTLHIEVLLTAGHHGPQEAGSGPDPMAMEPESFFCVW